MLERSAVSEWSVKINDIARKNAIDFFMLGDVKQGPDVSELPAPEHLWAKFYDDCYSYYLAYCEEEDLELLEEYSDIPMCIMSMEMVRAVKDIECETGNNIRKRMASSIPNENKAAYQPTLDNSNSSLAVTENVSFMQPILNELPPRSSPQERMQSLFVLKSELTKQFNYKLDEFLVQNNRLQTVTAMLNVCREVIVTGRRVLDFFAEDIINFNQSGTVSDSFMFATNMSRFLENISLEIPSLELESQYLYGLLKYSIGQMEWLVDKYKMLEMESSSLPRVFRSVGSVAPPFFNRSTTKNGYFFSFDVQSMGDDYDSNVAMVDAASGDEGVEMKISESLGRRSP